MAYQIFHHTGEVQSYTAGGTVTAGMVGSLDSSGNVVAAGTSSTNAIGIIDEDGSSGDTVRVVAGYLEVNLESAAAITAGANLETAASGTVDDTSGTGMTLQLMALEAASGSGEWIKCLGNFPCFI